MKRRAFTLIELLVVVAIIGLLSTIAVVSLSSTRAKARDVRRKTDMRALTKALEMYYADNSAYPGSVGACASDWACWVSTGYLAAALAPYLNPLPQDPDFEKRGSRTVTCGNWPVYVYQKNSNEQYCLAMTIEGTNDPDKMSCSSSCHNVWPNYYILYP